MAILKKFDDNYFYIVNLKYESYSLLYFMSMEEFLAKYHQPLDYFRTITKPQLNLAIGSFVLNENYEIVHDLVKNMPIRCYDSDDDWDSDTDDQVACGNWYYNYNENNMCYSHPQTFASSGDYKYSENLFGAIAAQILSTGPFNRFNQHLFIPGEIYRIYKIPEKS